MNTVPNINRIAWRPTFESPPESPRGGASSYPRTTPFKNMSYNATDSLSHCHSAFSTLNPPGRVYHTQPIIGEVDRIIKEKPLNKQKVIELVNNAGRERGLDTYMTSIINDLLSTSDVTEIESGINKLYILSCIVGLKIPIDPSKFTKLASKISNMGCLNKLKNMSAVNTIFDILGNKRLKKNNSANISSLIALFKSWSQPLGHTDQDKAILFQIPIKQLIDNLSHPTDSVTIQSDINILHKLRKITPIEAPCFVNLLNSDDIDWKSKSKLMDMLPSTDDAIEAVITTLKQSIDVNTDTDKDKFQKKALDFLKNGPLEHKKAIIFCNDGIYLFATIIANPLTISEIKSRAIEILLNECNDTSSQSFIANERVIIKLTYALRINVSKQNPHLVKLLKLVKKCMLDLPAAHYTPKGIELITQYIMKTHNTLDIFELTMNVLTIFQTQHNAQFTHYMDGISSALPPKFLIDWQQKRLLDDASSKHFTKYDFPTKKLIIKIIDKNMGIILQKKIRLANADIDILSNSINVLFKFFMDSQMASYMNTIRLDKYLVNILKFIYKKKIDKKLIFEDNICVILSELFLNSNFKSNELNKGFMNWIVSRYVTTNAGKGIALFLIRDLLLNRGQNISEYNNILNNIFADIAYPLNNIDKKGINYGMINSLIGTVVLDIIIKSILLNNNISLTACHGSLSEDMITILNYALEKTIYTHNDLSENTLVLIPTGSNKHYTATAILKSKKGYLLITANKGLGAKIDNNKAFLRMFFSEDLWAIEDRYDLLTQALYSNDMPDSDGIYIDTTLPQTPFIQCISNISGKPQEIRNCWIKSQNEINLIRIMWAYLNQRHIDFMDATEAEVNAALNTARYLEKVIRLRRVELSLNALNCFSENISVGLMAKHNGLLQKLGLN